MVAALGVAGCCGGKKKSTSSTESTTSPISVPVPVEPKKSKLDECKELIAAINKNGKLVSTALDKFGVTKKKKADADELAATLDTCADEVKDLELKDPVLRVSAKQYHDMLDNLSKAAKDANSPVAAKRTRALKDLEQIVKTEDKIVERINTHCGATPP
jgi:hypothetical protein